MACARLWKPWVEQGHNSDYISAGMRINLVRPTSGYYQTAYETARMSGYIYHGIADLQHTYIVPRAVLSTGDVTSWAGFYEVRCLSTL